MPSMVVVCSKIAVSAASWWMITSFFIESLGFWWI